MLSISGLREAAGGEGNELVVVLCGYFDDSSDGKRERYCAVGGLLGGPEQWWEFKKRWAAATYHVKGPFHAADCDTNPPRGAFKGWKKEDCDTLMRSLVKVLLSCKLSGYGSVVPVPEYKALFPTCDEYDPYLLALKHVLVNMAYIGATFQQGSPTELIKVQLWHEESKTTSARAFQTYADLKAVESWNDRYYLASFATGSKSLLELQAADLLAREAFKYVDNLGVRRTRIPVKRLRARMAFHLWNRECLEYFRSQGGPSNHEVLTDWARKPSNELPEMTRFYADEFVS
jgi:hypothetical protein